MYCNIIKAKYDKSTVNIILSIKNLKIIFLRLGTKQECSLSPVVFNIALEVLACETRQKRWNKRHSNQKWSSTIFICWRYNITHRKYGSLHQKKLLKFINELSKAAGYEVNTQKSVAFLYSNNKLSQREVMKESHL